MEALQAPALPLGYAAAKPELQVKKRILGIHYATGKFYFQILSEAVTISEGEDRAAPVNDGTTTEPDYSTAGYYIHTTGNSLRIVMGYYF